MQQQQPPKYMPVSALEEAAKQMSFVCGYFAALRGYNAPGQGPLKAIQLSLEVATLRVVVRAYWRKDPTPDEEADLGRAVHFTMQVRLPVISSVENTEGVNVITGLSREVPAVVN